MKVYIQRSINFKEKYILLFWIVMVFISGCTTYKKTYDQQVKFTRNWSKEFLAIKDPKLYKPLIEKAVMYFEGLYATNEKEKFLKSTWLMLSYSRLYIIEEQEGNTYKADIDFQKAKYWFLVKYECYTSESPKEAVKRLNSFTKEKVKLLISKLNPEFYNNIKKLNK